MLDKTKAQLLDELKNSEKARKKAEKLLDQAKAEAKTGVGVAQSSLDYAQETISRLRAERNDWRKVAGGSPGMRDSSKLAAKTPAHGDHVCPRTRRALLVDNDVYATEKRLRSERDAWRSFSGGISGQRGPEALTPPPGAITSTVVTESPVASTSPVVKEHVVRIILEG